MAPRPLVHGGSLLQFGDAVVTRVAAIGQQIAHHVDVWREALKAERAAPKRDPVGAAELAFLPAALEIAETPVSPFARATALVIAAFCVVAVLWASLGRLDIQATAPGKVIPSERVKLIQPLETAIVRRVLVREGEAVAAGQVLVELETTGARADVDRLQADLDAARAEIARLEAALASDPLKAYAPPPELPAALQDQHRALLLSQWREHRARLASLRSELDRKQAELKTLDSEVRRLNEVAVKIRDETARRREAAAGGFGSEIARLTAEKELAENLGQEQVQRARMVETRAAIEALKGQSAQAREEFLRDNGQKLAEARARAASVEQELFKAWERQRVQSLTAPVAGTVQQIKVHTVGGVVQPAQELMVVVPAGATLEIEAKLPNKDIAFVEAGQEAEIKVDALPFTKYGTIAGRVETLSLDAVRDEDSQAKEFMFPIRLSLSQTFIAIENGKRIPLTPGMTVVAEVKTGTRRPIEYILAPLQKYGAETARER